MKRDKFETQTKHKVQPFILELVLSCIININQSMFTQISITWQRFRITE
jgi:hypothetical protein